MRKFFTRERFGRPQILAGLLLLVFMAQCAWLAAHTPLTPDSGALLAATEGLQQWRGGHIAGTTPPSEAASDASAEAASWAFTADGYDPHHSPLWYLVAAGPLALWPAPLQSSAYFWGWVVRAPFLAFGMLLGASVWYVARRLYGNSGGFIALALYCFSPQIIRSSSLSFSEPEIGAAWGTFGAVFTAIAVTHTLYAPREVVLWNWRRIVLLGLSLALAIGSQFSLWILAPVALGFMLYLAPERRPAAFVIWAAALTLALLLLVASYFFRPGEFWRGMNHASFLGLFWRAYSMPGAYREILAQLARCGPALLVAAPLALMVYCVWPRTRYFGNTAPLLVAMFFSGLALGMPHYPGLGFLLMAVPFLFVFVAGIGADLLETRQHSLIKACVWGLLLANAIWNMWELARIRGS
jgi:hypothetical protein